MSVLAYNIFLLFHLAITSRGKRSRPDINLNGTINNALITDANFPLERISAQKSIHTIGKINMKQLRPM